MKLSIIIPAFNEERTISQIIESVKNQPLDLEKEIIVVDDGSTDKTPIILKAIKGIKLKTHEKNKGKGMAIRTGISSSTGDIILIQDADLELNPTDYPALISLIVSGKAEVVYGSRLLGKKLPKHTLLYYLGGRTVTFFANLLYNTNITDEPNGYKVFKADVIRNIKLECERFEFCPEITAKIAKKRIKIHEVPVKYNPRTFSEGKKVNWKDGVRAIYTLFKYKFKS